MIASLEQEIKRLYFFIDRARATKQTHCIASLQKAILSLEQAIADLKREDG